MSCSNGPKEKIIPINVQHIKDALAPLLYSLGFVHNNEDILDVDIPGLTSGTINIKLKTIKDREVHTIEHNG